jgi:hypothetical protein
MFHNPHERDQTNGIEASRPSSWQTVRCKPTRAKVIRVDGLRLAQGDRMGYSDVEVLTEK